jgi:hypothetical protein
MTYTERLFKKSIFEIFDIDRVENVISFLIEENTEKLKLTALIFISSKQVFEIDFVVISKNNHT